MPDSLIFQDGGLFSTIQDLGRFGYLRFGISASGAMDAVSMRIANALVGNPLDAAVLEITLTGPAFTVAADQCRVALAGAEFAVTIDSQPAECFRAYDLARGAVVRVGAARGGVRGYLAIAGGFATEPVLGSRSTHSRSSLGGWQGRQLRAGDELPITGCSPLSPPLQLGAAGRPKWDGPIRVLLGPQDDAFTEAGIETFLSSAFTVSAKADRMGYQLDGPAIEHEAGFNIVSDGIANGSIQVPGNGRPIVLLADRQTAGGYPKIATVVGADLAKLAQRRIGDEIRFCSVSSEEAGRIAHDHREFVARALSDMEPARENYAYITTESLLSNNLISGIASWC